MKEKIEKLKLLTNSFDENFNEYKNSKYDEANTRVDFIDKFFEILDWDVRNDQNYAESYREVVREDKVVIEGKPKAPDYSFRIGGTRKFFLEAKKPSVNIKEEIEPAFQIRRYGYTAKLPLSILTDFEEFAIYDTRIKPVKNDKASVARVFYCTYKEYEKSFDFIYNTFSKEAILKGSFDKYIIENKTKKGTSEVDKEFLLLIEEWRDSLAKNLAIRNLKLDIYSLNSAVQIIIDRIIFLRIAEDRNIESYGTLRDSIKKPNVYHELNKLFINANKKYNSGLFQEEDWIKNLVIDDKILQNIIKYLYYPDSPYELSVLPIQILGNIYEQFLGKTIRLTSAHQAKIEKKDDVLKAGGVYYTPQHIVDYIVRNTVGEKIKNLDLYEHPILSILDPSCGSGSFLVGVYSYLLEKYLESYTDSKRFEKSIKNGLIYQISNNTFRLSIQVKQQILLKHIYGVDIDNQAVEVTKLSLLLKLMEDENSESAEKLFKHSQLKLLPDLNKNIKCGNSLIDSDFYTDKDISLFSDEELRKVNTFDWEKEFPEIFRSGGFDCVIGNPPWISAWTENNVIRNYLTNKFKLLHGHWDTYLAFLEKSLQLINKKGIQSFILPTSLTTEKYASSLRKYLIESKILDKICEFGTVRVFENVSRKVIILIIKNDKINDKLTIVDYNKQKEKERTIKLSDFLKNDNYLFNTDSSSSKVKLKQKIESNSYKIGNIFYLNYGAQVSSKIKGKFKQDYLLSTEKKGNAKKCLKGDSIKRYRIIYNELWLDYQKEIMYGPRSEEFFESDKIIINKISDNNFNLQATYDTEKYYCDQRLICLVKYAKLENSTIRTQSKNFTIIPTECHELYFLAFINSKLLSFYFKNFIATKNLQGNYSDVLPKMIRGLPIFLPELNKTKDKEHHDTLLRLSESMLDTQKKIQETENTALLNNFNKKVEILENQINQIIYKLYQLDEDEIEVIENEN
ncbi:Eco57I restriction-modification methylase domain-containing protein [Leptospira jelokensis]|uniref:Eco57I restriction-modification methylase domain-containing protein n=1 Tax=Leptospira jelokensis TaxID=2484931 RepID=UPI001090AC44|nr:N-6 DNA methylase [Leptospira jelokensis]TGL97887.1 restriction endonuclease subunit R [Leptospira jelokensis]